MFKIGDFANGRTMCAQAQPSGHTERIEGDACVALHVIDAPIYGVRWSGLLLPRKEFCHQRTGGG